MVPPWLFPPAYSHADLWRRDGLHDLERRVCSVSVSGESLDESERIEIQIVVELRARHDGARVRRPWRDAYRRGERRRVRDAAAGGGELVPALAVTARESDSPIATTEYCRSAADFPNPESAAFHHPR